MFPTAEEGHRESMRRAVLLLDPAVPSNLSSTPGTGNRAGAKDEDGTDGHLGSGPRTWPEGKVFAGARTAVWTETEAGVRAGPGGRVFAETGIMTGTGAWVEVGAEWRPADVKGSDLTSMPRDPDAWLGLQTHRVGQRKQAAFPSVPTVLAETGELPSPALGKPLGLLSKAAWIKSSSSSSSKASSSPVTKASSLPFSSSSSSFPTSTRESQTAASDNVTLVVTSSNSSNSNSSSSFGMMQD